ncbi:unnamed protein product, partial [marine sediment metagenome]
MQIYNTLREKNELKFINEMFDDIICPNNDIGMASGGMHAYLRIVGWADLIIVSEYRGFVGAGVFAEVKKALKLKIPVKCLRRNKLIEVKDVVINDSKDIKIKYGKLVI